MPYLEYEDKINLNRCLSWDAKESPDKLKNENKVKLCACFNQIIMLRFLTSILKKKHSRYRTSLIYKFYINIENYIYFLMQDNTLFSQTFYQKIQEFKQALYNNDLTYLSDKYKKKFYKILDELPVKIKTYKCKFSPRFPNKHTF